MAKIMKIEGMMCPHCQAHATKALNAIEGVTATVDLESGTATITGDASNEVLTQAIVEAGYKVVSID